MPTEDQARSIVKTRADNRCEIAIPGICYGVFNSIHHRYKRGRGYDWSPSNLLGSCGNGTVGCHGWVELHPSSSQQMGYWLMAGDGEPTDVPVLMRWGNQRSWWYLDDEGMLAWKPGSEFTNIALRQM